MAQQSISYDRAVKIVRKMYKNDQSEHLSLWEEVQKEFPNDTNNQMIRLAELLEEFESRQQKRGSGVSDATQRLERTALWTAIDPDDEDDYEGKDDFSSSNLQPRVPFSSGYGSVEKRGRVRKMETAFVGDKNNSHDNRGSATAVQPQKLAPWKKELPSWSPGKIFQVFSHSSTLELIIRIFDIGSNAAGVGVFLFQSGWVASSAVAALMIFIIILIGSVIVSFSGEFASMAKAQIGESKAVLQTTMDPNISAYAEKMISFSWVVWIAANIGWLLDIILTAALFALPFGVTNVIGWVIGMSISLITEFVQMRAYFRNLVGWENNQV